MFLPSKTASLARGMKIKKGDTVCEIGIGHGLNSILAVKFGASMVFGCDILPEAVKWAKHNAKINHVYDRVDFRLGSYFKPFNKMKFDKIMSNMPYMPRPTPSQRKELGLNKEKSTALYGGPLGYDMTLNFINKAKSRLNPEGRIYFSIGEFSNINELLRKLESDFSIKDVYQTWGHRPLNDKRFLKYLKIKNVPINYSTGKPRFKIHIYELSLK